MTLHAMTLLLQRRLEADIEALKDEVRLHVLPPPCPLAVQPVDFGRAEALIERSLSDARIFLAAEERQTIRGSRARGWSPAPGRHTPRELGRAA
jgi:NTE family protein